MATYAEYKDENKILDYLRTLVHHFGLRVSLSASQSDFVRTCVLGALIGKLGDWNSSLLVKIKVGKIKFWEKSFGKSTLGKKAQLGKKFIGKNGLGKT